MRKRYKCLEWWGHSFQTGKIYELDRNGNFKTETDGKVKFKDLSNGHACQFEIILWNDKTETELKKEGFTF